jgi:hypothetical protein
MFLFLFHGEIIGLKINTLNTIHKNKAANKLILRLALRQALFVVFRA